MHIDDIASAINLMWKIRAKGVFNIGSGKKTNIRDIAIFLNKKLNKNKKIIFIDSKKSTSLIANNTKLRKRGWIPKKNINNILNDYLKKWIKRNLEKLKKNFNYSLKKYNEKFRSNHWKFQISRKKSLFKKENLWNFRNNNLSVGLDDQFYSKKQFLNNFKILKKICGDKFLEKTLPKKNIGNVKNYIKFKNKYFVDMHDIFFVKFLYDLEKNIDLKKIKYICDIGSGYGTLASKILSLYHSKKIILIDLPESNLLSAFYLKKLFPKKKIFYSCFLKNKMFQRKSFKKNNVFILNP